MAIATEFTLKLSCGHTETRDLSDQPAHNRKSYARWLENKGRCRKCFLKENQAEYDRKREENARTNMPRFELEELEGTEKQQKYGILVRDQLLTAALETYIRGEDATMDDDEFETRILEPARAFTHAGWWMDNKDSDAEELLELFDSYRADPTNHDVNENPF